jgi:hypothetical protein
MSDKKEPSCPCGFGHSKKKSAFGNSVDLFFKNNEVPANLKNVNECLNTVYNNVTPLSRFGSNQKNSMGPMKIGFKKK